jgi:predicted TIM-barrel fold metal-dependent hydrolase
MSAPGRLIDSHAHVYRRDLPMAPGGLHVPAHDFEIDEYEAILDRHGVSYAVIAAPSFLGTYNDYTLRAIRERPRFKTTVILNPTTDPYVLKAMDADRAIGVRLSLRGAKQLPDFTAYEYKLFFRRLADLDWHVHLHIEGQRLPLVLPALQAAPVKLVVDHFGRPDPALGADSEGFQALLRAFDTGRTWVKLSGGFRIGCDPVPLARKLMEVAGPTRLVWGSDCPFTDFSDKVTYQSVLDAFESWLPRAEDRAAVDAASRALYRFDR